MRWNTEQGWGNSSTMSGGEKPEEIEDRRQHLIEDQIGGHLDKMRNINGVRRQGMSAEERNIYVEQMWNRDQERRDKMNAEDQQTYLM